MPGKAQGMTVEIPGEAAAAEQHQQRHRKGDVNSEEYERNARVAEALQKCMTTPSSILTKQVSLTAADVEDYYMERLEKTKATGDPKLSVVFDRLDGDLKEALAAIASSSESLEKARQMDIGEIPGIDRAAAKLARLQQALDGLESDEVITSYLSDKSAIKVREGADRGNLAALKLVEKERQQWPPYMVMSSWDFADYRGNTAVHLATKNGHAECLEFLLLRGAQPSLVNAQGQSALHMAMTYDVAKLLLKHNADPVVLDQMGRTPYDVHKANRMGGARGVGGKLVVDAFALGHQKVTGSAARSILKERNMSPEEKAARAAAHKAKEDEAEAARQKKERTNIARSSYSQGLGALVVREFEYAVESFVTCLENDPAHSGAMLKLAKMAADGDSSAAAALDRLHAENEAAEAAEATAAAATTSATTTVALEPEPEPEPEPELVLGLSPSQPSLDGRAAAPVVTGGRAKTRSVLHAVESIPLSPMPSRGRPSSLVPTPPPTASGGLARSAAVPTMSPRAPPPTASGRRTLAVAPGRLAGRAGVSTNAHEKRVKLGGMTMLGSGQPQRWSQVKDAFRVVSWEKAQTARATPAHTLVGRRVQTADGQSPRGMTSAIGTKLPPIRVKSSQSAR